MTTFSIMFLRNDKKYQTVKITDIDSICAQMTCILKYNVYQIVKVTQVQA